MLRHRQPGRLPEGLRRRLAGLPWIAVWTFVLGAAAVPALGQIPAAPTNLVAEDYPLDGGDRIRVTWTLSPDDTGADDAPLTAYKVYRTMTQAEVAQADAEAERKARDLAATRAAVAILGETLSPGDHDAATLARVREARKAAADAASFAKSNGWLLVSPVLPGTNEIVVEKLHRGTEYRFRVESFGPAGTSSAETQTAVAPTRQWFDGSRFWMMVITVILSGSVIFFILQARKGKPINVRQIAGLEAVDEAVGRATEMGRSCLFVPGIQDMNDIQTIAGINVLARVAKTAAEYDASVEVPTSRSLVMTAARETVQSAFLRAGRPDAYNEDLIYYVTDEQFGYVAYLSGMMVREKPAACFYMGSFFAESLILAETGNSIGAIQVAGTAQPAQLPFFVAACDYTLIGEEFFAASAYLSGSAEELGSLKGQDVGKVVVAFGMLAGVIVSTLAVVTGQVGEDGTGGFLADLADFIKNTMMV